MTTILAEKPSVAESIAAIVGATKKENGFYAGGGYNVTWAYGHLLKLSCPEDGSAWKIETLPVLPRQFYLVPRTKKNEEGKEVEDPKVTAQLHIIERLFNTSDTIVAATDAGREGQLIFEYIYSYVGCTRPVKRLWISSMTEEAIRDGMNNLYDNADFRNLYLSAACRTQADWLVGINATRAVTLCGDSRLVLSMGRVQTPTLAMICRRYLDNQRFIPDQSYFVKAMLYKGTKTFKVRSEARFQYIKEAETVRATVVKDDNLTVKKFKKESATRRPPRLYSTSKIQEEASSRLGIDAWDTLKALQSLYATHKLITYPRTDTRYIPEDVYATIPALLRTIDSWKTYYDKMQGLDINNPDRTSVNPLKITDHHALIITGKRPDYTKLSKDEADIFGMIVERMLESFSPPCESERTELVLEDSQGDTFIASGSVVTKAGWRAVRNLDGEKGADPDDEFVRQTFPELQEGDKVRLLKAETVTSSTKAPALYTSGTLVHAMKYAGRNVDDPSLKATLKDIGLGTADTRAAEISTLLDRGYIIKDEEGHLIPTKTGLALYLSLGKLDIFSIGITGQWEKDLEAVANGEKNPAEFSESIYGFVKDNVVNEIFEPGLRQSLVGALEAAKVVCPYCGRLMENNRSAVTCACGFKIYRTIAGKVLDEFAIEDLIERGHTEELKGFVNKKGKHFSAVLERTPDKKIVFRFPDENNRNFKKK